MHLICLGYGYCAQEFAARHGKRFDAIAATCRHPDKAAAISKAGYSPVLLNGDSAALRAAMAAADVVLVSAGPDAAGDPFAALAAKVLVESPKPRRVFYLSTVGVYGDYGGEWVDESSALRPTSQRSLWRVAAETAWRTLENANTQVHVFRLSGIYGPGRSAIDNLREGSARRLVKPGQVFNRIHVSDIADTLARAVTYDGPQRIWNVTDDEPAPPQDVVAYGAGLLGMEPPPEMPFETAELSPMARSFYGENKRVSNRAIREALGVELNYPTYREGLKSLI